MYIQISLIFAMPTFVHIPIQKLFHVYNYGIASKFITFKCMWCFVLILVIIYAKMKVQDNPLILFIRKEQIVYGSN